MKKTTVSIFSLILLLSLSLSGCNFSVNDDASSDDMVAQTLIALAFTQTAVADEVIITTEAPPEVEETTTVETEAPTIEVVHTITPGTPGWINKWFYDTDTSKGTVTGGDDFVANLYERPFTETDMVYRPDVDINKTEMSEDGTFYYVTLYLHGEHPDGGLQSAYGIEIDTDRNGRGDLLVIADRPTSTEWDIAGVSAFKDPNKNVGGSAIMRPDTAYSGDGYEQTVFSMALLDDPDAAWARVTTDTPPSVTIAFKKSLISGFGTFVWGVWAADSLLDPALIDLHDNFTQAEAGSPYATHSTYPLKALNLVDNTCRETYGFEADVPIPGLCVQPEIRPTATSTTAAPGSIYAAAIDDLNNNGIAEFGEPLTVNRVIINLYQGSCSGTLIATTMNKEETFTNLAPGAYCVTIIGGGTMTSPNSFNVDLPAGGHIQVFFLFQVVI